MFACNPSKFRNFTGKKVFVVAQGRYWDPILKRFYLKGTSSVFEGTIEEVDLTKSGNRRFFSKHITGISITVKAVREVVLFPRICCLHTAQGGKHHQWDILQPAGTRVQGDGSGRKSDHPHTENQCFL